MTHINITALNMLAVTSEQAIGRHFLEVINDEGLLDLLRGRPIRNNLRIRKRINRS